MSSGPSPFTSPTAGLALGRQAVRHEGLAAVVEELVFCVPNVDAGGW
jgi:hypothetical protein